MNKDKTNKNMSSGIVYGGQGIIIFMKNGTIKTGPGGQGKRRFSSGLLLWELLALLWMFRAWRPLSLRLLKLLLRSKTGGAMGRSVCRLGACLQSAHTKGGCRPGTMDKKHCRASELASSRSTEINVDSTTTHKEDDRAQS